MNNGEAAHAWGETSVRHCLADEFPGAWGNDPVQGDPNALILRSTNLDDDGHVDYAAAAKRQIGEPHLSRRRLCTGDVLLEASGGGPGKPVGRVAHFHAPDAATYLCSNFFRTLRPNEDKVHAKFFAWRLLELYRRPTIWNFQQQTTGIINLQTKDYLQQRFLLPEKPEQSRIAEVLDTIDEAIVKAEMLIAKLRQVRAGLVHDLLTRGLDEHGQLRDPVAHSEQFQDTPVGLIPMTWRPTTLGQLVPTDRPIVYGILMPGRGYQNGIPVIKVKDIRDGRIDISDLLLTDPRINEAYRRSRVRTGDLLFTIRGTVGRTAFVPPELDGANITQDTARISLDSANPTFVARWLEMPVPTRFIEVHTLGVAVRGINLGDVRRIPIAIPPRDEQDAIAAVISSVEHHIETEANALACMRHVKTGLMSDLLTGRVRVPERASALEDAP